MESNKNNEATPEQIAEYKKLKLRNEWIEYNRKRLDQIESHRLFSVRLVIVVSLLNLIVSLLNYLL